MDKYDYLIIKVLKESVHPPDLDQLKVEFWKRVSPDDPFRRGGNKLGQKITNLYLAGSITKGEHFAGYLITNSGRKQLELSLQTNEKS